MGANKASVNDLRPYPGRIAMSSWSNCRTLTRVSASAQGRDVYIFGIDQHADARSAARADVVWLSPRATTLGRFTA